MTTIIITVIKIKPKIRYIILQALGITFTLFSHLANTRTEKETRPVVLCWLMPLTDHYQGSSKVEIEK